MGRKNGIVPVRRHEKQAGQRTSVLVRVLDYFRYVRPVRAAYIQPVGTAYVRPAWREGSTGWGEDDRQNGLTAAKKLIHISGLLTQTANGFDPSAQNPAQASVQLERGFEQAKSCLNDLLAYINQRPLVWAFFDDRTAGNFRSVIRDFQRAEIALQKAGRAREQDRRWDYIQTAAEYMERAARTLDAVRSRAAGKLQG